MLTVVFIFAAISVFLIAILRDPLLHVRAKQSEQSAFNPGPNVKRASAANFDWILDEQFSWNSDPQLTVRRMDFDFAASRFWQTKYFDANSRAAQFLAKQSIVPADRRPAIQRHSDALLGAVIDFGSELDKRARHG